MSFALQLEKFATKTKDQASDLVGLVVLKLAAKIDYRSPVGDSSYWISPPPAGYIGGHFRANWQLGVGVIPQGERNAVDQSGKDPERGGDTTGQVLASLPGDGQNAGKIYWLVNNAPYARRLEDGWSRQAPQGMVGLAVAEFSTIVRDSAAEVRR
jgi:hypothetical protein